MLGHSIVQLSAEILRMSRMQSKVALVHQEAFSQCELDIGRMKRSTKAFTCGRKGIWIKPKLRELYDVTWVQDRAHYKFNDYD